MNERPTSLSVKEYKAASPRDLQEPNLASVNKKDIDQSRSISNDLDEINSDDDQASVDVMSQASSTSSPSEFSKIQKHQFR